MRMPVHGVKKIAKKLRNVAIIAVGVAVIAGCSSQATNQEDNQTNKEKTLNTIKVTEVAKLQISEPLEHVADVVASAQVHIVSKAGADVLKIVKERGSKVSQGEVIVILDDSDAKLQQEQAKISREGAVEGLSSGRKQWQNSVKKVEQALTEATKTYNKMRNDYDLGLVGKSELDQAENVYTNLQNELALLKESSVSALELQLKSAELTLEMSNRSLEYHEIKAPIDGVITDLSVQEGMTVNPGFGVGQIQQIDPIKIKALLSAESADLVRGKSELQFYVPGNAEMFTGKISYLADIIDTQTNAYELNLTVQNPDTVLKPGMKVQVRLTEEAEQVVVAVPTLSIVREGADNYVFVLVGDKAERRKVELGRINELNQEVISGVKEGEQLIISGQHQLKDGEQVIVAK